MRADFPEFQQKSSLIDRLRWIMIAMAIFSLLSFVGVFLSSRSFLTGLTQINRANNILNATAEVSDGIGIASLNILKLAEQKTLSDAEFSFDASMRQVRDALARSLLLSESLVEVHSLLRSADKGIKSYEDATSVIFNRVKRGDLILGSEPLRRELLVAGQYEIDIREAIRKTQIAVRAYSNENFAKIYQNRHQPLWVSIALSLSFFAFVALFGLTVTRKISLSIGNLIGAADRIARGDMDRHAPIIDRDEIGRLTHTFNRMIVSLKDNKDRLKASASRTARLQSVTAAFSEALQPDEVTRIIMDQGFEVLGAESGLVAFPAEDGVSLKVVGFKNFDAPQSDSWWSFPINAPTPASDAFRHRRPVFVPTIEELEVRYPELAKSAKLNLADGRRRSWAALPMVLRDQQIGVIGLRFYETQVFSEEDVNFMVSLAKQCSQAYHRSRLYEDAQKAIRTRDEFLSIASHELRTPITPLKLQLQILLRDLKRDDQNVLSKAAVEKMAKASERQVGRLASLVEDLLDVSRINAGRLSLNREECDLTDMVREVLSRYHEQIMAAHSSTELELEPEVVGNLDRLRMEQILINLLTNALKYAPGKPVKIELRKRDGWAELSVHDQGPGIAEEDHQRIFDRFERVNHSLNVGGLGLGLYISQQITSAHGGTLSVKSELGAGSTFTLRVPLYPEVRPMEGDRSVSPPRPKDP